MLQGLVALQHFTHLLDLGSRHLLRFVRSQNTLRRCLVAVFTELSRLLLLQGDHFILAVPLESSNMLLADYLAFL